MTPERVLYSNPKARIEEILGIQREADPTFTRPAFQIGGGESSVPVGRHVLSRMAEICFGQEFRNNQDEQPWGERLFERLRDRPRAALLLRSWPPSASVIMDVMQNDSPLILQSFLNLPCNMGRSSAAADNSPLEGTQVLTNTSAVIANRLLDARGIFVKHCGECHQGEGASLSGYPLPLNDLQQLRRYGSGRVLEYLEEPKHAPRMPPTDASIPLSDEDREILIQSLRTATRHR